MQIAVPLYRGGGVRLGLSSQYTAVCAERNEAEHHKCKVRQIAAVTCGL